MAFTTTVKLRIRATLFPCTFSSLLVLVPANDCGKRILARVWFWQRINPLLFSTAVKSTFPRDALNSPKTADEILDEELRKNRGSIE